MREAVGGGMLMYIILPLFTFLSVFMIFIAKYAIAYRDVNTCISGIESCQGRVCDSGCDVKKLESKYANASVEYESLGNGMCMARVKVGVDFEIPFVGKYPVINVSVESKSMHCGA